MLKHSSAARPTIAILGTGLIGTSIGLALHKRRCRHRVVGWDSKRLNCQIAKRRGAVDDAASSLRGAVAGATTIFVAVPLAAMTRLLPRVFAQAASGALIIDTAPLKKDLMAAAIRRLKSRRNVSFVGGHPLAGSERSGPAHANAALFEDRTFFLCSHARSLKSDIEKAERIVRKLGAYPVLISPIQHDRVVAATSALPQIVASTLMLAVADRGLARSTFLGPAFHDVTRLAASSPDLWTANLLANKANVLQAIHGFERHLRDVTKAILRGEAKRLATLLMRGAVERRQVIASGRLRE